MNKPQKKTMTVREMGRLLGLKKVESYWLVHKQYFDTILVNGKMRVVIESFENWYAGQVKYHKVSGEPPGEQLKQDSYSARDIAQILGISESYAYDLMSRDNVDYILVDYWKRFPKEAFEKWYQVQTRYRNQEDRWRDADLENRSMSMPEMARILDVPRNVVYSILDHDPDKNLLEIVVIADRRRITYESFDRWYSAQNRYYKPEDQPEGVPRRYPSYQNSLAKPKVETPRGKREVRQSENPDYLTVDEAAVMAEVNTDRIFRWIKVGYFPAFRISRMVTRIPRKEYEIWLDEWKMKNRKGE